MNVNWVRLLTGMWLVVLSVLISVYPTPSLNETNKTLVPVLFLLSGFILAAIGVENKRIK